MHHADVPGCFAMVTTKTKRMSRASIRTSIEEVIVYQHCTIRTCTDQTNSDGGGSSNVIVFQIRNSIGAVGDLEV